MAPGFYSPRKNQLYYYDESFLPCSFPQIPTISHLRPRLTPIPALFLPRQRDRGNSQGESEREIPLFPCFFDWSPSQRLIWCDSVLNRPLFQKGWSWFAGFVLNFGSWAGPLAKAIHFFLVDINLCSLGRGDLGLFMGITTTVAGRKGKGLSELSRETTANTNGKSKKNRRKQKKTMLPIQRLFDTCKEVFSHSGTNTIPSPQDVERLKTVLGKPALQVLMDELCSSIKFLCSVCLVLPF